MDDDPAVVAASIGGGIHDPQILTRQLQLLRAPDEWVRQTAYRALEAQRRDARWSPAERDRIEAAMRPADATIDEPPAPR